MKTSINWLNDHLDLSGKSIEEMADLLTFAGIEVEDIQQLPDELVVAQVKSSDPHPDANKLSVCQVDDGSDTPRQIVCGAKNYQVGDKIPLALPGAKFGDFEIKNGKLRGVESHGMMCSASELGLSADHDGLMILPADLDTGRRLNDIYPPVYVVEVTPNRPDLLSHLGMARELAALNDGTLKGDVSHASSDTPTRAATASEITISDTETCPLYTGRYVRGVKVGPSPDWLQEKLSAIGLRPINNVVDITNYVLMEMGHPLHAFDLAKLKGGIHVRRATEGEKFLALDENEYTLSDSDCVIADAERPHALGGVMGGEDSGVTETTTDILLEAAWFTPSQIRRTAHRLEIHSDSSYRFERGTDPAQVIGASDLAIRLLEELTGGKADPELLIAGETPATEFTVPLSNDHCRSLIGHPITDAEIASILTNLGLQDRGDGTWAIPSYRLDLRRSVDLIEEVARVYGLENIPGTRTGSFVHPSKADLEHDYQTRLRGQLSALGFHECQTIKMIGENQLADNLCTQTRGMTPIRVKNPMTDTHSWLRPALLPSLLRVAEHNVHMGADSICLFEMGTTFVANPKGIEIEQPSLALLMTGPRESRSWQNPAPTLLDLHALRGVIEAIAGQEITLKPLQDDRLLLAAEVLIGKAKLGLIGQVHPARARAMDLDQPVLVGELALRKLANATADSARYTELPNYPGSTRDVAIDAPIDLQTQQIVDYFAALNEPLLESYQLFDLFADPSGEKLAADRKSLAWTLTYRDRNGTMESATVDTMHQRILDGLKKALPVEFR